MAKRKTKVRMTTMNISLPATMRAKVERDSRKGGFANTSEYFRFLVRSTGEFVSPAWLEDMVEEGLKGPFEVADDKWWAERAARLEASIARREMSKPAKSGNARGGKSSGAARRAA